MHDHELDRTGQGIPRREPAAHAPDRAPAAPQVQRSPALDAAAVMHLQRAAGNQSVVQLLAGDEAASPVEGVVGSGGGSPLPADTRAGMEAAFGASFDHVRVHTDDKASRSAEAVGAHAYTVGSDVVFRSGQYNPSTPTGQRTIAHELAHVVQQSQGPVDGTDAGGGIRLSSPSDRFEQAAEATADQVMGSVQRQVAPEEEEQQAG